jgi:NADPH:quinone reductase-like Zn-dependent oxidoreductase
VVTVPKTVSFVASISSLDKPLKGFYFQVRSKKPTRILNTKVTKKKTMLGPAVLLIGASGFVGSAVSEEFLAQKSKFRTVAVLAAPEKVDKFRGVEEKGIKIIIGSSTDSSSYRGKHISR